MCDGQGEEFEGLWNELEEDAKEARERRDKLRTERETRRRQKGQARWRINGKGEKLRR